MLITLCKAFIRPHLDYVDVLYDQAFNNSLKEKLESFQCNACLALTGAIGVRQKKKFIKNWDWSPFEIYAGVESFAFFVRSWKRKILNIYSVWFLPDARYTRLKIYIISPLLTQNTIFFKNSFFPSTIIEWIKLDPHLRKSEHFSVFKSNNLKFIRPSPNSVYNCHNPRGIFLITRLRLCLSHLREHIFKHGF